MKMNRDRIHVLRERMVALLAPIESDGEFKIQMGSARFDEHSVTFKISVIGKSDDGTIHSPFASAFLVYAPIIGMELSDLGKKFFHQGSQYTVSGYNARSRKLPIIATRADNKMFKFSVDAVLRLLGKPRNPEVRFIGKG